MIVIMLRTLRVTLAPPIETNVGYVKNSLKKDKMLQKLPNQFVMKVLQKRSVKTHLNPQETSGD